MREIQQLILLSTDDGYQIKVSEGQTSKIKIDLIKATISKENEVGKVKATLDEFTEPITFDEDTDPILLKHYKKFFCGKWSGKWYIECISVQPKYLTVHVTTSSSVTTEIFHIRPMKPESYLKFSIEAPNRNGEMESYTVEMSVHKHRHGYNHFMKVTEPDSVNGTREIVLSNGALLTEEAQCVGENWMPAYVIDRR